MWIRVSEDAAAPPDAYPYKEHDFDIPIRIDPARKAEIRELHLYVSTDQGKTLFEGVLAAGQTYSVPQTAAAPLLRAGAPEALRINVGSAVAPPVGPAGKVASNVSLAPADLMRGGSGAGPGATATVPAPSAPPAVQNRTE